MIELSPFLSRVLFLISHPVLKQGKSVICKKPEDEKSSKPFFLWQTTISVLDTYLTYLLNVKEISSSEMLGEKSERRHDTHNILGKCLRIRPHFFRWTRVFLIVFITEFCWFRSVDDQWGNSLITFHSPVHEFKH